jgi:AmmeMemoRadiSam system protein A/AmmeMemoRadiSam system protein B
VAVIAPSHRDVFRGVTVYEGDAYATPLGSVPVDTDARDCLLDLAPELITSSAAGHRDEHAIEVQIPFLQRLFPGVKLLPLTMLERSQDVCRHFGSVLAELRRTRPILLVASSDLYHGPSVQDCGESDDRTLAAIRRGDPDEFLSGVEKGAHQACGAGPIASILYALRQEGSPAIDVLMHRTSADVTGGDTGYVVGYGAVALASPIRDRADAPDAPGSGTSEPGIDDAELLREARRSIEDGLHGRVTPGEDGPPEAEGGAFVTLWKGNRLRGCIGLTVRRTDLLSTIREVAHGAAFRDPRFDPVTSDELDEITLEISLLSPLRVLADPSPEKIRVGVHGLQISLGGRRGLLLPQVAVEAGWDEERFLRETCRKAGLDKNAWRDPNAVVKTFTARKIREGE